jgi:PAS domain S-box-containing protein
MQKKNKSNTFKDNFRELLNSFSDPIMVLKQEGVVLVANKAVCTFLGVASEELIGKHFEDLKFLDKKTKMLIQSQLEKRMKGEVVENYEIPVLVNGETKYFEPRGNRIEYFGEPADLIVFHDVTERRQLQSQLLVKIAETDEHCQESEEKYRKLFQESMDAILVADLETGIIVDCNTAAQLLVGRNKSELIGQHQSILHPQTLVEAGFTKGFKEHVKGCPMRSLETQVVTKTGEIKYVSVRARVFEFHGKKLIQGTFRDITERKLMQQALQENEEKFHGIANSVRDTIILVGEEDKVTYWNPAAEKIFGYTSEEAIGKDVHELVVPNAIRKEGKTCIHGEVKKFAETHMGNLASKNGELICRRKNGSEFPAELSMTPIKLGRKWNVVAVVKDTTQKKQSEQKLREAEQRYHALFNQAPLGVLVVDPETTALVEFNDVANRQLGYSKEEFAKLRIADIEAKETTDGVKAHTSRMVKEGGSEFETKHRTKDGEVRDVLVTTRTVELGGKTFLYCIFHDITDIRKVQDALMKSETQYRQLVELAQEGVWALDNEYCTAFVNPRMAQMLGYAESEMVGRSIFEFVDKKDIEQTKQLLGQSKHGVKGHFEYEFTRKDGSRVYASIAASAINDDEENRLGTLALVADVTEDKRMQKELKQEHFRLEAIANSIGAGFVIISPDYRILWANRFMREYKGNVDGKLCYATLNTLDAPCPDCGVKKVLEEGVSWDAHEYFSTDIKGNPYWVELIATPIKDADGKVETAIEVAVDITEKKNLQNKLAQYSQKLEKLVEERTKQLEEAQLRLVKSERLAAIGELAGMVGHDLRNPLTGIENAAYFLKTKGATISEAQAKEMLETIGKCVEHSNKIVSDLFDYSKEIRLEPQESSPRNVLSEALDMVQVPAKVEILNLIPDEQHLNVDPDKIERVFINLIKNAIDAMPNGGKITIDSKEANGSLEISFADIGTGISNEILPKIFSPLFTTKAQGMGLGLAICKRIIEAHGGTITVKTAKGKGTTFTVTLPIKREPEIGGEKVWINMPESSLSTMTKA